MDSDFHGDSAERFFSGLTEFAFQTQLGIADPPLVTYISKLLSRFIHRDSIFCIRNPDGVRLVDVVDMLAEADSQASQGSIASALGFIGDVRSVEPLIEMLGDRDLTATARAFAAAALGNVCDPEPLPWSTPFALDVNYRALTSTLLGGARGVLEIL